MLISLPDDVVSVGYKQTRPFQYEQVFSSKQYNFTGTEEEFVKAGIGYKYIKIGEFKRQVIEGKCRIPGKKG